MPEENRRQFLQKAAGYTVGVVGTIGVGAVHLSKRNGRQRRETEYLVQAFEGQARTELVLRERVPIKPRIGGVLPIPGPNPDGTIEGTRHYVVPREFLELNKSHTLSDPAAVAKVFGLSLTEEDRRNPDMLIGCFQNSVNDVALISVGNLEARAKELSQLIDAASEKRDLPARPRGASR